MAKKLDVAKLAEKLAGMQKGKERGEGPGLNFLSIKDGRNVVRILPPRDDMDSFAVEVYVHYGVGKSESNKKGSMIVCPTTHDENARCPVCELSKQFYRMSKKKDDTYSKQAKEYIRKKRVYYNVISRDEPLSNYKKNEEGKWINKESGEEESPVKILATGVGIFEDLLKLICDPEYGDITDAEEGLDVIITKSGQGQFNTNYDVKTVRKNSDVGLAEWESLLNDMKPLTVAKTYDEISAMMSGNASGSEEAEGTEDEGNEEHAPSGTETHADDSGIDDEIAQALAARRNRNK